MKSKLFQWRDTYGWPENKLDPETEAWLADDRASLSAAGIMGRNFNYPLLTTNTIGSTPTVTGNKKFTVVCGGGVKETDDLKEALTWAEESTHANQKAAVIFKAIKKVSPKRDTVVTDLD